MRAFDLAAFAALATFAAAVYYQERPQAGGPITIDPAVASAFAEIRANNRYVRLGNPGSGRQHMDNHIPPRDPGLDKRQEEGAFFPPTTQWKVQECRLPKWEGGCFDHVLTNLAGTCFERHYERIPNSMKPDPGVVCDLYDGPNCKDPGKPSMMIKEFITPGVEDFRFDARMTRAHFDNGPASFLCAVATVGEPLAVGDSSVVQSKPDAKYKWNEILD